METVKKVVETVLPGAEQYLERGTTTMNKLNGCPVAHNKNSLTCGPHGPVAMCDLHLLEKVTQFDRENIPARNVHALGNGCYGHFTCTKDISQYTRAKMFTKGKRTDLFCRMSGVFTEKGDPDTNRDPRGFAMKFYTEEGNWDLLAINTPVFNVRDMKVGPDAIHAFKRDPRTGMYNPTQTWDFVANHPESLHQTLMLYTDRDGTPASFRYMHSYGVHTFSMINAQGARTWVKFHLISEQGTKGLTQKQAKLIAGEDPNFLQRDLREAIERGDYPRWKFCIQVMNEEEGYKQPWTFDATKAWKHSDYPLIEVGIVELNRNPVNHFSEVEQVAFSPANLIPGIGVSPDKLLQGRLLIYDDTQHHRIGPNHKQLFINRPKLDQNQMYLGGNMNLEVKDKFPHYWPNSFRGPEPDPSYLEPPLRCDGPMDFYNYPGEGTYEDYYFQPKEFLNRLITEDKQNLIYNIATSLEKVKSQEVIRKVMDHMSKIDTEFANAIHTLMSARMTGKAPMTEAEKVVLEVQNMLNRGDIKAPITRASQ